VKHDGWRAQLHLLDGAVTVYGKNGGDLTCRFASIALAVARLPVTSVILDAELVACDGDGAPNFYALMRGAKDGCCAYCFDLLELEGRSLVGLPLDERRHLLRRVLRRADKSLRLSETFTTHTRCSPRSSGTPWKASFQSAVTRPTCRARAAAGLR
jgi:bifunctional non-homologous end joining protein LigD